MERVGSPGAAHSPEWGGLERMDLSDDDFKTEKDDTLLFAMSFAPRTVKPRPRSGSCVVQTPKPEEEVTQVAARSISIPPRGEQSTPRIITGTRSAATTPGSPGNVVRVTGFNTSTPIIVTVRRSSECSTPPSSDRIHSFSGNFSLAKRNERVSRKSEKPE